MRHLATSVALILSALAASAAQAGVLPHVDETAERLQRQTPALMASSRVPGLSMALVTGTGIVWHGTFGLANARTREPVAKDAVFEAASLSKAVFAYAVLQLVDAGLLGLDTPLVRYLPGGHGVGEDPRLAQMPARHVLSHRTGFPNWRTAGAPLTIHFAPGDRFSYSGEGFVYLGRVVERVTGESTERTVKRLVFDPLGMMHSSFLWQDSHAQRKVFGHDTRGEPQRQRHWASANPASSLSTTAPDFGRFLIAVLNGERLRPDTASQMLHSQVRVGPFTSSIGRLATPLSDEVTWGLGWGLQQRNGDEAFWHWGDNGNSKAFAVVSRTHRRGLVFFANSANGLAIALDLVALALGEGGLPGLEWLDYPRWQNLPPTSRRDASVVRP